MGALRARAPQAPKRGGPKFRPEVGATSSRLDIVGPISARKMIRGSRTELWLNSAKSALDAWKSGPPQTLRPRRRIKGQIRALIAYAQPGVRTRSTHALLGTPTQQHGALGMDAPTILRDLGNNSPRRRMTLPPRRLAQNLPDLSAKLSQVLSNSSRFRNWFGPPQHRSTSGRSLATFGRSCPRSNRATDTEWTKLGRSRPQLVRLVAKLTQLSEA